MAGLLIKVLTFSSVVLIVESYEKLCSTDTIFFYVAAGFIVKEYDFDSNSVIVAWICFVSQQSTVYDTLATILKISDHPPASQMTNSKYSLPLEWCWLQQVQVCPSWYLTLCLKNFILIFDHAILTEVFCYAIRYTNAKYPSMVCVGDCLWEEW